jgi:hypothetical protein
MFIKNQLYQVKADHPFHSNRIGRFQFLGGPEATAVVLTDPKMIDFILRSVLMTWSRFNAMPSYRSDWLYWQIDCQAVAN